MYFGIGQNEFNFENIDVVFTKIVTPRKSNDIKTIYGFISDSPFPFLYKILNNNEQAFDKYTFGLGEITFTNRIKILEFFNSLASIGFPIKEAYPEEDDIFNHGYLDTTGEFAYVNGEKLIWDLGTGDILIVDFLKGIVKVNFEYSPGIPEKIFNLLNNYS